MLKFFARDRKTDILNYTKDYISKNKNLREIIEYANGCSKSSGVSLSDYVALYQTVRRNKPKFVLECGTGKTTMIIAQAMIDNCEESPCNELKLISMEHNKEWYDHAVSLIPEKFNGFLEIHYSPMDTYGYSFIRGTVYKETPDYPYEFVFVDGPSQGFEGEATMCNMALAKVVEMSEKPVTALIDNRKHTVLAYTMIFGVDKVKYYLDWSLGFVNGVTCHDMLLHDKNVMKRTIFKSAVQLDHGNPF